MTTRVLNALSLVAVMRRADRDGDMDTLEAAAARHALEVSALTKAEMVAYIRAGQGLTRVEAERAVGL